MIEAKIPELSKDKDNRVQLTAIITMGDKTGIVGIVGDDIETDLQYKEFSKLISEVFLGAVTATRDGIPSMTNVKADVTGEKKKQFGRYFLAMQKDSEGGFEFVPTTELEQAFVELLRD
jgi:hypothetical protein